MLLKLLEYLVAGVVTMPERIKIERIETAKADIFFLSVAKEDLGRLLGKRGQTIEAIRTVLSVVGRKLGKEAIVDVVEKR